MKRITLSLVLIAALYPGGAHAGGSKALATVNGEPISSRDLAGRVMEELNSVKSRKQFTAKMGSQIQERILAAMIDEELLFQEAKRNKVVPNDATVKKAVASIAKANGGRAKLLKGLKESHRSIKDLERSVRRELALRAAVKKLVTDASIVSDKEAKAKYDEAPEKFKRSPTVNIRQIFINVKKGAHKKTWAKAKAKADGIVAQVKAGEDWAKLAQQVIGKKKSKNKKGGDSTKVGKWISKGNLLPALEKVAFSLKAGEVGGPVKVSVGYVLIRVDERREGKKLAFEEVSADLKRALQAQRSQEKLVALMKRLHAEAKIVRSK